MNGRRAKAIRKTARRLWTKAINEHPHLKKTDGCYRRQNILKYQKDGKTLFETDSLVKLGYRRVVQNLKWLHKHGYRGPKHEQTALTNAIAWSNAK